MRVFSVDLDGGFTEYEQWLEANPGGILEDGPLLIIGRQVPTDLGNSIDLLGVDREGNVVVVELKRDRTPRDVVGQALEYAAFAAKLDANALEGVLGEYRPDEPRGLAEHHREYFNQSEDGGRDGSPNYERFIDGMTRDAYGGQDHVRHMMARLLQD